MLLLAWVFSVSWLAGYVTGLLVAPVVEPRKRTRGAELDGNGHQAAELVPPMQADDLTH